MNEKDEWKTTLRQTIEREGAEFAMEFITDVARVLLESFKVHANSQFMFFEVNGVAIMVGTGSCTALMQVASQSINDHAMRTMENYRSVRRDADGNSSPNRT